MPIRIACPSCQRQYLLADDLAGKKIRCKSCNAVFKTPDKEIATPAESSVSPANDGLGPREAVQTKAGILEPPAVAKKGRGLLVAALLGCGGLGVLFLLGGGAIVAYFFLSHTPDIAPPKVVAVVDKNQDKPDDFNLKEARKSIVHIKCIATGRPTMSGSGFLVSKDGLVYTNRHVVQPRVPAQDHLLLVGVPSPQNPDKLDYFKAEMVYVTPTRDELDFALLKIAARPDYGDFPALPLSHGKLALADHVAAVGYPIAVKAETAALSFNQGRISSVEVIIDKKPYYQTDAAVNGGNSGGPLINAQGEAVGIVTYRKNNANNMGFAVYLTEVKRVVDGIAQQRIADARPAAGPIDPKDLPNSTNIEPTRDTWIVTEGKLVEKKEYCLLHNDGSKFCVTSKEELPESFQLTMMCANDFDAGNGKVGGFNDLEGTLRIRFGTADTSKSIMDNINNGCVVELGIKRMMLRAGNRVLVTKRQGTPFGTFLLIVTRQGGQITVMIEDEIVMSGTDPTPIPGRHKLSIGGIYSKVLLGEVVITPLDDHPIIAKEIPKAKEIAKAKQDTKANDPKKQAAALVKQGEALMNKGLWEEAIGVLREAVQLDPKSSAAHEQLGTSLMANYQTDEAIAEFRIASKLAPDYWGLIVPLVLCYCRTGELDEALMRARHGVRQAENPPHANRGYVHSALGAVLAYLGQLDEAFLELREGVRVNPSGYTYYQLGAALERKGLLEDAISAYRQAVKRDRIAYPQEALPAALAKKGETEEAISILKKIIAAEPNNTSAKIHLGKTFAKTGQLEQCHAAYRDVLLAKPVSDFEHLGFAWIMATSPDPGQRNLKAAVEHAKKATKLNVINGNCWSVLGVAQFRNGDWKAAMEAFQKSLKWRHGGDAVDWFFLAMTHWQLGDRDAARTWFDKGAEWMDKNNWGDLELRCFRAEAAQLLGIIMLEPKEQSKLQK